MTDVPFINYRMHIIVILILIKLFRALRLGLIVR